MGPGYEAAAAMLGARPCCMADHFSKASSLISALSVNAPIHNLRFVRQCFGTRHTKVCRIVGMVVTKESDFSNRL